jgi:hypothetical protein
MKAPGVSRPEHIFFLTVADPEGEVQGILSSKNILKLKTKINYEPHLENQHYW